MAREDLDGKLKRLLIGLVDQEIVGGKEFLYDGAKLHADEVAVLMLTSVVRIAQDVSERVGLGSFGYHFSLGNVSEFDFPLLMERVASDKQFFEVAPFVIEVFEGEVMDCRFDLARLFESAARLMRPNFSLDVDSNYGNLSS